MNLTIVLLLFSFTHAFDIEVPYRGFTVSPLELSYATSHFAVRTSPVTLPFMLPLTLRVNSHHLFARFTFATFYGGYMLTSYYNEIKSVNISPLFAPGIGAWIKTGNLIFIPDVGVYLQKNTSFYGKLAVAYKNLFLEASTGTKGFTGMEILYALRVKKAFLLMGLRYPGINDMSIYLPVVPLLNAGITF